MPNVLSIHKVSGWLRTTPERAQPFASSGRRGDGEGQVRRRLEVHRGSTQQRTAVQVLTSPCGASPNVGGGSERLCGVRGCLLNAVSGGGTSRPRRMRHRRPPSCERRRLAQSHLRARCQVVHTRGANNPKAHRQLERVGVRVCVAEVRGDGRCVKRERGDSFPKVVLFRGEVFVVFEARMSEDVVCG